MRRHWTPLLLMLLAQAACSMRDLSKGDGDSTDSDGDARDTGSLDDTDGVSEQPVYLRIGGSLRLEGGLVDPGKSQLSQELLSAEGGSLCLDVLPVTEVTASDEAPEEGLLGWWDLQLDPPAADCADRSTDSPSEVELGFGLMVPEIAAVLAPEDLDEVASSLFAAYASFDHGANVYVFGVAGRTDQYDGTAGEATDASLQDGDYEIRGIYTFKLED